MKGTTRLGNGLDDAETLQVYFARPRFQMVRILYEPHRRWQRIKKAPWYFCFALKAAVWGVYLSLFLVKGCTWQQERRIWYIDYFYSCSLAGNITESYFRVISGIIEVISLNFATLQPALLSSSFIQRWQPQCCITKHHLADLWHCFVHKLWAAWVNEANHPASKAVCDQSSTCIESPLNTTKT